MTEKKYPSQLAERFQIRLPDGLRDRIRDAAASNNRSMNAEIVHRLNMTIDFDRVESWTAAELDENVSEFFKDDAHANEMAEAFARQLHRQASARTVESRVELIEFIAGMMGDYGLSLDSPEEPPFVLAELPDDVFARVKEAAERAGASTLGQFISGIISDSFGEPGELERQFIEKRIHETQARLEAGFKDLADLQERWRDLTGSLKGFESEDFPSVAITRRDVENAARVAQGKPAIRPNPSRKHKVKE